MVAPIEREKQKTRQAEIAAPNLNCPKVVPRRKPAVQPQQGNWGYRLLVSGCLILAWCLVNGFIMLETKAYNWQKSQVSAKEMQIRQLRASIAQRLSELVKDFPQPQTPLTLLSLEAHKPKPTLLGRR
ncbi:MAG: hypothetical protein N2116_05430 [Armatimonadetes bacterium]|nr:hypothetical protein [Armatimonadota bacterium]